jgi:hypothetical protein
MKIVKKVLMPKGTALWLKIHTKLTFTQIQDFCQLDFLTLSSLNESNTYMQNPIELGQLSEDEIKKSENDPNRSLINTLDPYYLYTKKTIKKITEEQKLQYMNVIAWFYYNYRTISPQSLQKFFDIKLSYINKVLAQISNTNEFFESHSPVKYGFCSQSQLDEFIKNNIK